jgi:two-component system, cell cycle sensor histidine kinase and response regulator CckA
MDMEVSSPASSATPTAPSAAVILLVEDEAVVREITARVLQSAGYEVLECSGPNDALGIAGSHAEGIDLLLTDVVMPEMNGIDLAEQIRCIQPRVVTVFMSGYAETDILRKASAASATHIQKPFTLNCLLSRVAEALKSHPAVQGKRRPMVLAGGPCAPELGVSAASPSYPLQAPD